MITGDYALGCGFGAANNSFEVRVDGAPILSIGPHANHSGECSVIAFGQFSVMFVATATSHVIEFAAETNGSDHDYYVDNLCIETSVPVLPSTWGNIKSLYGAE